jgi:hypothetical protein
MKRGCRRVWIALRQDGGSGNVVIRAIVWYMDQAVCHAVYRRNAYLTSNVGADEQTVHSRKEQGGVAALLFGLHRVRAQRSIPASCKIITHNAQSA